MAGNEAVWGIDVGQAALKAMKLRAAGEGNVELLAYDVIEHPKILSWADADVETLIRNALEKFQQGTPNLDQDKLVVSVPGSLCYSKFFTLPPVEAEKREEIIAFEAKMQIPFPIEEVVWDYEMLTAADAPEQKAGIFCIKREDAFNLLGHYKAMKPPLPLELVQAAPLALFNFMKFDGQMGEGTTALLNIGAETSDLVISDGENIFLRNIALGGNSFTKALAESFKLPYPKAENLKKTAASSKHAKQIFQQMRPVFADFAGELQRTIARYQAQNRESEVTKVLGLGNAFLLPGLQKYLEQHLNVPVVKVERYNRMVPNELAAGPKFQENVLSFAVAYGLAVQGLGLARLRSNLLPPEVLSERRWKGKRPWFAAATGMLAAGLGLALVPRVSAKGSLNDIVSQNKAKVAAAVQSTKAAEETFTKKQGDLAGDQRAVEDFTSPLGQKRITQVVLQDVMAAFDKVNRDQFAEWKNTWPAEMSRRGEGVEVPFLDAEGRWQVVWAREADGSLKREGERAQVVLDRAKSAGKPKRNSAKLAKLLSVNFEYSPDVGAAFLNRGGGPSAPSITAPPPIAPAGPPGGPTGPGAAVPGAVTGGEPGFVVTIRGATTAGCATEANGGGVNPDDARNFVIQKIINSLQAADAVPDRTYRDKKKDNIPVRQVDAGAAPQTVLQNASARGNWTPSSLLTYGIMAIQVPDAQIPPTGALDELDLRMRWLSVGEYEGDLVFNLRMKVPLQDVVDHLNATAKSETGGKALFRLPGYVPPAQATAPGDPGAPPGVPGVPPAGPGIPPAQPPG